MRLHHPNRYVALIALPPGLWSGSGEAAHVVEQAGGLSIPVFAIDPVLVVAAMRRFSPNLVISSPSFMAALTREAQRQSFTLKLDSIYLGGEVVTAEHRKIFGQYWQACIFDTYGMTEIGGGQAVSLPHCSNLHLNGFQLYTEIIDPLTGQPADEGELVFTPLVREAMPLLRYRSGDLARWTYCSCWPVPSIQLTGRVDDMLVVGDLNLFCHVLAEACATVPGATGRIAITVRKDGLQDVLHIAAEGNTADTASIQQAIFNVYPDLPDHIVTGYLHLEIECVPQLPNQFKQVRCSDLRRKNTAGK
jgi:phenylacetate-CoA ligase